MSGKPNDWKSIALGLWWVSWLGFICAFLLIGWLELHREYNAGGHQWPFGAALLGSVVVVWTMFFVGDAKSKNRTPDVVRLRTLMGTCLVLFTLIGIFYFVEIAPFILNFQ